MAVWLFDAPSYKQQYNQTAIALPKQLGVGADLRTPDSVTGWLQAVCVVVVAQAAISVCVKTLIAACE